MKGEKGDKELGLVWVEDEQLEEVWYDGLLFGLLLRLDEYGYTWRAVHLGFEFSEPLPKSEAVDWLSERREIDITEEHMKGLELSPLCEPQARVGTMRHWNVSFDGRIIGVITLLPTTSMMDYSAIDCTGERVCFASEKRAKAFILQRYFSVRATRLNLRSWDKD